LLILYKIELFKANAFIKKLILDRKFVNGSKTCRQGKLRAKKVSLYNNIADSILFLFLWTNRYINFSIFIWNTYKNTLVLLFMSIQKQHLRIIAKQEI
jgi:hypothetical protein